MTITVDQITNESNSGIYDVLMGKINKQLDVQFQNKRISGKEYADVYLGVLTSVLGQSIQYVISAQTADAQTSLVLAQKAQVEAETQKAIIEKQLAEKNVIKLEKEILLAEKQLLLLDSQLSRTNFETDLVKAKINTEKAQYLDVVDGQPVTGVIGKQKALFDKQAQGFDQDARQKVFKVMADTWAIQKSTEPTLDPNDTGLHDTNIKAVVLKVLEGIGVTPTSPPATP